MNVCMYLLYMTDRRTEEHSDTQTEFRFTQAITAPQNIQIGYLGALKMHEWKMQE